MKFLYIFLSIFLTTSIFAQNVGIGLSSPSTRLNILGSGAANTQGILVQNTLSNNTPKGAMSLVGARYNSLQQPFSVIGSWDNGLTRSVFVGGGSWSMPDPTELLFYTAPLYTETTNTGVERMRINQDGHTLLGPLSLGATSESYRLHFADVGNNVADPLYISRQNVASDRSDLRVTIGDNPSGANTLDYFSVGTSGSAYDLFNVRSDGNVGIGVRDATDKLVVGSTVGGNLIRINDINTAEWKIGTGGFGFNFLNDYDDNGTYDNRMMLTFDGRLGINTTSPEAMLSVIASKAGTSSNWYDPGNYAGHIHHSNNATSRYGLLVSDYWRSSENFVFAVDGRYYVNGTVSGDTHSPYFVVRGDGNVGVSTSSPSQTFSVAGILGVSESGSTGGRLRISSAGTGAEIYQADNSPIVFKTQTTVAGTQEKLKILDNGNVGIGLTSPGFKLDVNGNMATTILYDKDNGAYYIDPASNSNLNNIYGNGGDATAPFLQNVHAVGLLQHHDGNSGYNPTTWHQAVLGNTNNAWGVAYNRLYLRRGDNSYTNEITVALADGFTSDRKLKTNITPMAKTEYAILHDKLMNTNLYHYQFINDPNANNELQYIGFMADEVPEEMMMPNHIGIKTGDTFAMIVASLKVLAEENKALKAELEEIKKSLH